MTRFSTGIFSGVLAVFTVGLLPAASWGADPCGFCCQRFHCPPHLKHCMERPPCIKWRCGCPRPIVNPCEVPNWGYFETCWTPWPWPANFSHCPVPPPAAFVAPGFVGVLEPGGTLYRPPPPPPAGELLPRPKN